MDCSLNSHVEGCVFHKSLSLEKGTHFEGESRPSDDPLSVPEAHSAEPRRDNKVSEIVKQRERVNSFIKSLPESLSA
jgi:hypothetical protein